ncbi:MAG: hypothetical protein A2Y25_11940 [Candidatus Melainabacteria bacterium GWF2_37_15]|nr:MAG: hypothetical protein A2Y25_11940 [Candidatus Melainabacteria bacterium GWF2_37_15]
MVDGVKGVKQANEVDIKSKETKKAEVKKEEVDSIFAEARKDGKLDKKETDSFVSRFAGENPTEEHKTGVGKLFADMFGKKDISALYEPLEDGKLTPDELDKINKAEDAPAAAPEAAAGEEAAPAAGEAPAAEGEVSAGESDEAYIEALKEVMYDLNNGKEKKCDNIKNAKSKMYYNMIYDDMAPDGHLDKEDQVRSHTIQNEIQKMQKDPQYTTGKCNLNNFTPEKYASINAKREDAKTQIA